MLKRIYNLGRMHSFLQYREKRQSKEHQELDS